MEVLKSTVEVRGSINTFVHGSTMEVSKKCGSKMIKVQWKCGDDIVEVQ